MRTLSTIILLSICLICQASLPGLSDSLTNIIRQRQIGVALITSDGDTLTAGSSKYFELASVVKFHQAAAISRITDFDTLIRKSISVTHDDLPRNTWSPMRASATKVPFEITPVELFDYSLNMSDNNAADLLFKHFSSPSVTDSIIRSDYGIGDFGIGATEKEMHKDNSTSLKNYSTPLSAAELIYRFFTADTTASATLVKAVMARNTPFGSQRIPAGMPTSSAKVFHKTGTGFTAPDSTVSPVNDLAFVSYPTARGFACYSLAVFTNGMALEEAEKFIADISRVVYTAVIVKESLAMNADTKIWARSKPTSTGIRTSEDSYTWGDIFTDAILTIVDNALTQ